MINILVTDHKGYTNELNVKFILEKATKAKVGSIGIAILIL
jgi:hypothetical protein